MATRRIMAAFVAALMLCVQPVFAQTVTSTPTMTVTSTTPEVDGFERVYKKHVKELPKFCKKKKKAQMHCALAPLLYNSAAIWEERANEGLVRERKCDKDLGACENTIGETPAPVEPEGIDLGVVGEIFIYIGVAAAAGAAGYGIAKLTD